MVRTVGQHDEHARSIAAGAGPEPDGFQGYDVLDVALGDLLRGERATLGKSLLDVERELKIRAAFVAAIENGDVGAFPSHGFIPGYVRSYGRYLGIDPEWTFRRFCEETGFQSVHGVPARQARDAKRGFGAAPRLCPIARDDPDSLREALAAAEGADVIVTLGGASVGDHDLVADVFGDMGLALEFHKVAMRPGKPLMSGRIGDTVMIGLPGNPVSAMVCGEIFVRPALDAAMGLQAGLRATRPAPLAHDLGPNGSREHYMRAMMDDEGRVRVFDNQDSSLIHVLAAADALVVRPPHAPALPAGAAVRTVLL